MTSAASAAVASGHPLATAAGLETLRHGGSAVDAALAMAFAQWAVSSPQCGPGGEMVVLLVKDRQPVAYAGWATTPAGFPQQGPIPYNGPGAAVVPGAVPAAYAVWRDHGRLPWSRLFEPAIAAVSEGHRVTESMAASYLSVARKHPDALGRFLDVTEVPAAGDTVSSQRFAETLSTLAAEGPSALHGEGRLKEAVTQSVRDAGGFVTASDLCAVEPTIEAAESVRFDDGLAVSFPGYPSQSSIITELLATVEPNTPVESAEFVGQVAPATEDALTRRCVVGLQGTATAVAALDDCAAVVVHSLAGVQYGTGFFAGDTAIALGNRVGTAHTTRNELPGAHVRPGEHPVHTLSAMWLQHGERSVLVATPGGDRQVQWLAQTAQRFRQGIDIDQLVGAPRWFVCPEGDRFGVPGGIGSPWYLFAEPGIRWRGNACAAGYDVRPVESAGGGLQGVQLDASGMWSSASDPRAGGSSAHWSPLTRSGSR